MARDDLVRVEQTGGFYSHHGLDLGDGQARDVPTGALAVRTKGETDAPPPFLVGRCGAYEIGDFACSRTWRRISRMPPSWPSRAAVAIREGVLQSRPRTHRGCSTFRLSRVWWSMMPSASRACPHSRALSKCAAQYSTHSW